MFAGRLFIKNVHFFCIYVLALLIQHSTKLEMPRLYKLLSALRSNDKSHRATLFFIFILWLLWFGGYFEFIRETNFQQFQWPPYVNVRQQVVLELTGQLSEFAHYNRWTEFRPLVQPTCKKNWLTRKRSLLIIVKSAPDRLERRNAYRKTIANVRQLNGYRIRTIFVMGHRNDEPFNGSSLQVESAVYNDMLVGNFHDNYFNNTYKYMHSIKLARWHCYPKSVIVPFVVLMDDDYILRLDSLIALIGKHQPNEQLYLGQRVDTTPFRLSYRKFTVTIEEFPFDAYPPYITGGFVLYSPQALREVYIAAQYLKMFRFDDIYAGIIAYYLSHYVQHNAYISSARQPHISWDLKIAEHSYSADDIQNGFLVTNFTKT